MALPLALATLPGVHAVADPAADYAPRPLTATELDDVVAPVALYPDVVLDSLLPATTVPADVAAASEFVAAQDGSVTSAPAGSAWDPSVVALLQFPDVLRWMGENPAWVERTGFAVSTQQADVLAAVQRYRATARDAGVLASNAYETVTVSPQAQIVIVPARVDVVYVPVYDPWLLRQPYAYSPQVPFFQAWFSFSFGDFGYWSRHRIFWGAGIYEYGDPWWSVSWRSGAADWGTGRPSRWGATHRADQPWHQSGWSTSTGYARPTTFRAASGRTAGSRTVRVAPPDSRTSARTTRGTGDRPSRSTGLRQPSAPAAPITRWRGQSDPAPTPRVATPRSTPRAVAPSPAPRLVTPTPGVAPRGTVNGWIRRGNRSLERGTRTATPIAPQPRVAPAPRIAPESRATPAPRATPRVRAFPRPAPTTPAVDGARARTNANRGRRSLNGS